MSQDPVITCFSLEMFSGLYLSAAFSHKNKTFYDYVFHFKIGNPHTNMTLSHEAVLINHELSLCYSAVRFSRPTHFFRNIFQCTF